LLGFFQNAGFVASPRLAFERSVSAST
jgi:hypothetical protein